MLYSFRWNNNRNEVIVRNRDGTLLSLAEIFDKAGVDFNVLPVCLSSIPMSQNMLGYGNDLTHWKTA